MTYEMIAVAAFFSLALLGFEPVQKVIGAVLGFIGTILGFMITAIAWLAYIAFALLVIGLIIAGFAALGPMWAIVILLFLILLK